MFSVTVTGTFTYTGSSSTCTKSIASATSKNANWKISSKSASKSGNKATAKATAKRYVDGTAVETQNCTVTLTCSLNGSLSPITIKPIEGENFLFLVLPVRLKIEI